MEKLMCLHWRSNRSNGVFLWEYRKSLNCPKRWGYGKNIQNRWGRKEMDKMKFGKNLLIQIRSPNTATTNTKHFLTISLCWDLILIARYFPSFLFLVSFLTPLPSSSHQTPIGDDIVTLVSDSREKLGLLYCISIKRAILRVSQLLQKPRCKL